MLRALLLADNAHYNFLNDYPALYFCLKLYIICIANYIFGDFDYVLPPSEIKSPTLIY